VTLRVTDQAGTSATDTVKIAVYDAQPTTLSTQSKNDATPGVLSNGIGGTGSIEFQFTVPAGLQQMDVTGSWALPVNDYDMRLVDPTGAGLDGPGLSAARPNRSGSAIRSPAPGRRSSRSSRPCPTRSP
jgi:hypothetical protein